MGAEPDWTDYAIGAFLGAIFAIVAAAYVVISTLLVSIIVHILLGALTNA